MKKVEVFFTELSQADYNALSPELREECAALLKKLRKAGKRLGIPLENKNGKDLRGYYKLYFNNARHRVVYTVTGETIEITAVGETLKETLEITGIGKRDREYIYELVYQRIAGNAEAEMQ
jgi:mRNA-degrading endonuclease RelE of RelBE toxin-antitoxin system